MEIKNKMTVSQKMRQYIRHPLSGLVALFTLLGALIAITVLIFLVAYILVKGIPHINKDLFAFTYNSENASLMPALINTLMMTVLTLAISTPI